MNTRVSRFARVATSAVLAGLLTFPTGALAATKVTVGETDYEAAHEEDTWSWNGADDMTLNGYDNGGISAVGDLIITVTGDNTVTSQGESGNDYGILVRDGDLTITGDGSLTVQSTERGVIGVINGALTVEEAQLTAIIDADGSYAGHGSVIDVYNDMTINNATVTADYTSVSDDSSVVGIAVLGDINIVNSSVEVRGNNKEQHPLPAIGTEGVITIDNSHVHAVVPNGHAVISYVPGVDRTAENIVLKNVEGDTSVEVAPLDSDSDFTSTYLNGEDGNVSDILIDPIPEPEPEPEPEPDPEPEPEPAPEPAPEPVKATIIPQTGDAAAAVQTVQGIVAGIGSLLSAAGVALKRRED